MARTTLWLDLDRNERLTAEMQQHEHGCLLRTLWIAQGDHRIAVASTDAAYLLRVADALNSAAIETVAAREAA